MPHKHWLMKAEPNSRIEKGKDVKFSVDDFEAARTTPWEGVRNHEAKKLMQSMKVGDKVLFYHSNCKVPGVAAFAEVAKEAYPDYTAWDPAHPYYDAKSDKAAPRWFMVDVAFKARCTHFVPLALFKRLAALDSSAESESDLPPDVAYIGATGVRAIKGMALVNRGRLSVQPVEEEAWDAVQLLSERGGWDEDSLGRDRGTGAKSRKNAKKGGVGSAKNADPEAPKSETELELKLEPEPEHNHETRESKGNGKGKGKSSSKASAKGDSGRSACGGGGNASRPTRPTKAGVGAGANTAEGSGSEKNDSGDVVPSVSPSLSPSSETRVEPKGGKTKTSTRKRKASTLGGDAGESGEAQEGRVLRRSTRARK